MIAELLTKPWRMSTTYASESGMDEVKGMMRNFEIQGVKSDNTFAFYKDFYDELNSRIDKARARLDMAHAVCDKRRFPCFMYCDDHLLDAGGDYSQKFEYQGQDDKLKLAAASLNLVKIVEQEADMEAYWYNLFDAHEEDFRECVPTIKQVGGMLIMRRPLINVVLPKISDEDPLGYRTSELIASQANYNRLQKTIKALASF